MAQIGKFNTLKVIKMLDYGIFLDGGNLGRIFMPRRFVPKQCQIGDEIKAFVFLESQDRIIATTQKPFAQVDEFAYLKVVSVSNVGAFLDWGLQKDLFVPFSEQKTRMQKGRSYVVYVYLDSLTDRIVASSKVDKFLDFDPIKYEEGESVDLIIADETEIGYKAIINHKHWGLLYRNEVFKEIHIGDRLTGYIHKIRDDEKIDLSLYQPGYDKIDGMSQKIYDKIKQQNGFIPLNDKSSPESIYDIFGISKKAFKQAIGALYKKRMIIIGDDGVRIVKQL